MASVDGSAIHRHLQLSRPNCTPGGIRFLASLRDRGVQLGLEIHSLDSAVNHITVNCRSPYTTASLSSCHCCCIAFK